MVNINVHINKSQKNIIKVSKSTYNTLFLYSKNQIIFAEDQCSYFVMRLMRNSHPTLPVMHLKHI